MKTEFLKDAFADARGSDKRMLDQLLFLFELERLKTELRQTLTYADKEGANLRRENVAEHSWHITAFALLLKEYAAEPVDVMHTVEMMLFHDVVETYAGDTDVYSHLSADAVQSKEAMAAERIYGLLPPDQGARYKALWEEFEAGATPESRYARAIDRVHPILANFLTGGQGWHQIKKLLRSNG